MGKTVGPHFCPPKGNQYCEAHKRNNRRYYYKMTLMRTLVQCPDKRCGYKKETVFYEYDESGNRVKTKLERDRVQRNTATTLTRWLVPPFLSWLVPNTDTLKSKGDCTKPLTKKSKI